MRRIAYFCLAAIILSAFARPVAAQPKPKDPLMYSEMQDQFRRVTDALTQILARLSTIETEVNRLKQLENEAHNTQALIKAADEKLSEFKVTTGRDLVNVTRDVAQLRSEVVTLNGEIARARAAQATAPAAPQQPPPPEGYITEVGEAEVTINLGSAAGLREGMRFAVFKAGDANKTQIGTISIKQILDANAAKAEIIFKQPDVKFQFSDGIRPLL